MPKRTRTPRRSAAAGARGGGGGGDEPPSDPGPSSEFPVPSSPLASQGEAPSSPVLASDGLLRSDQLVEEDDGEELIGDDMERDYQRIAALDTYSGQDLDTRRYREMSPATRRRVEAELRQRDRAQAARDTRVPLALMDADDDDEGEMRPRRRRRLAAMEAAGDEDVMDEDMEDVDDVVNLEEVRGSLREWILMEGPRREIAKRFSQFLRTFVSSPESRVPRYVERIRNMCAVNKSSLEVDYVDLSAAHPLLAIWVADAPAEMLEVFDEVAYSLVTELFENYSQIASEVRVRISELPIQDSLRDLRHSHLNALVRVVGVVTRRTSVYPQLTMIKFNCLKCNEVIGPFFQNTQSEFKVSLCPECQSKGPFEVNVEQTIYRNFQKLVLQETPGSVPPGRIPRSKEVILVGDLIDIARPGEEITVTGIFRNNFDSSLNTKHGFPVFATVIEANLITKKEDEFLNYRLTDNDIREIREISQDPNVADRVIASIAPSIYGHTDIKTCMALAMFGGVSKVHGDRGGHRIRGDINVLLMGDPGTAKSQILKYVEKTAPRAVYTTGQGASAVGLTASVHKDPVTREWTLEGGALVLADRGVCLIDEFDKMTDQDRTSIHEAMEQQTISISKAGIVTTLQARCAVIAAANPIKGRYDPTLSFVENVELTDPILSRFDLLCVVRDQVDPMLDEQLASFVVSSHICAHPVATDEAKAVAEAGVKALRERLYQEQLQRHGGRTAQPIPQELLRKYIMYARQNTRPQISDPGAIEKISNVYADMRRAAHAGGIEVTVRSVESVVRIAEAYARMHLRSVVKSEDVDRAITVMLRSFIGTQKYGVARQLSRQFARHITTHSDNDLLLLDALQGLVREYAQMTTQRDIIVPLDEFRETAKSRSIPDPNIESFFSSAVFRRHNFRLDRANKRLIWSSDRTVEVAAR